MRKKKKLLPPLSAERKLRESLSGLARTKGMEGAGEALVRDIAVLTGKAITARDKLSIMVLNALLGAKKLSPDAQNQFADRVADILKECMERERDKITEQLEALKDQATVMTDGNHRGATSGNNEAVRVEVPPAV